MLVLNRLITDNPRERYSGYKDKLLEISRAHLNSYPNLDELKENLSRQLIELTDEIESLREDTSDEKLFSISERLDEISKKLGIERAIIASEIEEFDPSETTQRLVPDTDKHLEVQAEVKAIGNQRFLSLLKKIVTPIRNAYKAFNLAYQNIDLSRKFGITINQLNDLPKNRQIGISKNSVEFIIEINKNTDLLTLIKETLGEKQFKLFSSLLNSSSNRNSLSHSSKVCKQSIVAILDIENDPNDNSQYKPLDPKSALIVATKILGLAKENGLNLNRAFAWELEQSDVLLKLPIGVVKMLLLLKNEGIACDGYLLTINQVHIKDEGYVSTLSLQKDALNTTDVKARLLK